MSLLSLQRTQEPAGTESQTLEVTNPVCNPLGLQDCPCPLGHGLTLSRDDPESTPQFGTPSVPT